MPIIDHTGEIHPQSILALTFTRAAAQELRRRVGEATGTGIPPRVTTLHSFALRQLLRNAERYHNIPQPLRIVDDWEERLLVQEDIKNALKSKPGYENIRIEGVQHLLKQLASDWETLAADENDWVKHFPNPDFIGIWQRHRDMYGYTLRSQLVYQLKTALFSPRRLRVGRDS